jgi:hypothetical protein
VIGLSQDAERMASRKLVFENLAGMLNCPRGWVDLYWRPTRPWRNWQTR